MDSVRDERSDGNGDCGVVAMSAGQYVHIWHQECFFSAE